MPLFVSSIDQAVSQDNQVRLIDLFVDSLRLSDFAIYDKGYHTGSEFAYANRLKIDVLVAIPSAAAHAPDLAFDVEHFKYDLKTDSFTCPANQVLTTYRN